MKKLFAVLLAVLLIASLAACGSSSSGSGETKSSPASEQAAKSADETKAEEKTEAPESQADEDYVSWPSGGLFDLLPKPESDKVKISYEGETYISVEVHDTTQEDYTAYVEKLKAMGYTEKEDAQHAEHVFDAVKDGYELMSSVQSVSKVMHLQLRAQ